MRGRKLLIILMTLMIGMSKVLAVSNLENLGITLTTSGGWPVFMPFLVHESDGYYVGYINPGTTNFAMKVIMIDGNSVQLTQANFATVKSVGIADGVNMYILKFTGNFSSKPETIQWISGGGDGSSGKSWKVLDALGFDAVFEGNTFTYTSVEKAVVYAVYAPVSWGSFYTGAHSEIFDGVATGSNWQGKLLRMYDDDGSVYVSDNGASSSGALLVAIPASRKVTLTVEDAGSGQNLSGVSIEENGIVLGTTNENGTAVLDLSFDAHTLTLTKTGYSAINVTIPQMPTDFITPVDSEYSVVMYPATTQVNLSDYSYWPWRREITITNPNSYSLSDFQVKIELNSTNFNFSRSFGNDIRFSWLNQSSGQEVHIPYYIESWDSFGEKATIWIKVPYIPANGTAKVYLYYGNSLAQSESDPNQVFEFFDDFETWEGWTQYGSGQVSQDSTYVKHGSYSLKKTTAGDPSGGYKAIGKTLGRNIILEAWIMRDYNSGSNSDRIGLIDDNGNGYGFSKTDYGDYINVDKRTGYTGTVYSKVTAVTTNNIWYWCQLIITDTQIIAQLVDDNGALKQSILTDTAYNNFTRVYVFGGYPYYVDELRIRKYAPQEPIVTVSENEENVYFESQPPGTELHITLNFKDDLGNTINNVNLKVDGSDYGVLNSGDIIVIYNGTHTFTTSKEHYITTTKTLDLQTNATITLTLNRENYTVIFYAYDYNNTRLDNFQIYANNTLLGAFDSGDSATVKYGAYIFKFSKAGYRSVALIRTVSANSTIVNFTNIYPGTMHRVIFNFYDASNNSILNNVTVLVNNEQNILNSEDELWLGEGNYTLTFSKANYENKTLSLEITNDMTMSVYLAPISQNATTTKPTEPSTMQIDENFNDFGLWGAKPGAKFMAGNWDEAFTEFWTLNPMFSLMLPLIFSLGLIIVSYLVSRNALVPIGVTAIMATFFSLIGVPLHLSLLSPLAGLFIFFIVWVLWDFYKRFEKS